ncbi:MAG: hypothetical protein ACM3SY_22415 [Candidatus Omnitrophota bacterium]
MDTLDYRIPKIEAIVDIAIDNGVNLEQDEYVLFLDKLSLYRKGEETIFEFLNKKKKHIPIKKKSTGEFCIVNLDEIAYVSQKGTSDAPCEQTLLLHMVNHCTLQVAHMNTLPEGHSRILDYLNQESQFLLFFKDEQKLFVNKTKIVRVEEK